MADVVRFRTSWWIDQPIPSVVSDECAAPGPKTGSGNSPSRNGSVSDAVRNVIDTGAGGAMVFGQSAPATDTRRVLPGVHS